MRYNIGDIVYLKTDTEQKVRIVTGILIRANIYIYYLSSCTEESSHYDIEISSEVNEVFKLINNN